MSNKTKSEDRAYRELCSEKTLQSNSKGFFLDFADFVTQEVGEKWIKNVFGKLKSDRDRMRCVYTSKETKVLLEQFLVNVQEVYRPKNGEFSQKKRLEAEALLKQNENQKAQLTFSQSILRAPKTGENTKIDSGLSLTLALWGRSQAFLKLHKFSEALTDIQQALKENLPGSYRAQAFWKMGICYRALGEENRAKVSFDLAENLLLNDENQRKLLNEDRYKSFKVVDNEKRLNSKLELPRIEGLQNKNIPYASTKLTLKKSRDMGRYVVANQHISTGETLIVEPPYISCLLPEMFGTHCHHCYRSLGSSFGCSYCSSIAFCSIECKEEAETTYHKYECKYLDLLIGSGMSILGHTALRMITKEGLHKSLEIYKNKDKERIYQMCANAHLRPPGDFLQRTLMAAFLLRCLQKSSFFGKKSGDQVTPSEEEYVIGEMLLFNLQVLQFNAHEIYETRHTSNHRIRESKNVYIGVAVYLTSALLNHDCHPAVSRHFVGKNIVLTSVRPIKTNEMVPENYGPVFTRKNLAERQITLSSRYWFACQCLACTQDWPPIDRGLENCSKRLRCPTETCSNLFTLPIKKISVECPKCKSVVDLSSRIALLEWVEEQEQLGFEKMDMEDTKGAIEILCPAIDMFYKISVPPNKTIHLAEHMVQICLSDSGNTCQTLVKTT